MADTVSICFSFVIRVWNRSFSLKLLAHELDKTAPVSKIVLSTDLDQILHKGPEKNTQSSYGSLLPAGFRQFYALVWGWMLKIAIYFRLVYAMGADVRWARPEVPAQLVHEFNMDESVWYQSKAFQIVLIHTNYVHVE